MGLKGYVFALDALLSLIIALTIGVTILHNLSMSGPVDYGKLQIEDMGNDFLLVLEKNNEIDDILEKTEQQAEEDIESILNNILSAYVGSQINISIYDYNDGFILDREIDASKGIISSDYIVVRRLTLTKTGEYAVSTMKLWYE